MKEENVKRKKSMDKRIVIPGGIVLAVICGFFVYNLLGCASTDDAYVETTTVQVSPKVSGQIVAVHVKDNQSVKKGDLIAEIEDVDYKIKVTQATARYEQALMNQKNARANHSAVKTQIATAKADYERYKHSYELGAVSQQAFDAAKTKYEHSKASLTNTQEALVTKAGTSVADAQIQELKALKDQAELYLSYTKIYAPQDGTIATKKVSEGMMVQPGTPLLTIVPNDIWVVANFKENQLEKMREGQDVDIKVDAFPHTKFKGKVDSIQRASGAKASMFPPENAVGSFVKIVQRIPVKIVFVDVEADTIARVVPGMSVVPKVNLRSGAEN